jgi:hypothetical protein
MGRHHHDRYNRPRPFLFLANGEPFATRDEIDYILEAANAVFPSINLNVSDVISTFSGLRPVINTGAADPSKESRAHVVWEEEGLITVTGGKLTTFRIMAEEALQKAADRLPHPPNLTQRKRYFTALIPLRTAQSLPSRQLNYLQGRYGSETNELLSAAVEGENQHIANLPNLWSEIRWAVRSSAVEHLDDLLLRRVRLGMLLPAGASAELSRIRSIPQPEIGWSDAQWRRKKRDIAISTTDFIVPSPRGSQIKLEEKMSKTKFVPAWFTDLPRRAHTVLCSNGVTLPDSSILTADWSNWLWMFWPDEGRFVKTAESGTGSLPDSVPSKISEKHLKEFRRICGEENVRTDTYDRVAKSYGGGMIDALRLRNHIIENIPEAVVAPRSQDEIEEIVKYCLKEKIAVYIYGAGSTVTRGMEAVKGGISLDMSNT